MEQKEMDQVMQKASVLIEALPYIQKFNRKIIVVKYGGSAMSNEELQRNVIQDVTLLKLVGFKPIIVHGGGKAISKWVGKVGKEAKFVNGLRVTDEETMEIAEMVLGRVNKNLVTMVEELGVKAVGISGKDGGLLKVNKKYADGQDIGYVGEINKVDPKVLYDLLEKDFLPIVAPVGWMMISIPIISMRMTRPAPLPGPWARISWFSSRISKACTRISMTNPLLYPDYPPARRRN